MYWNHGSLPQAQASSQAISLVASSHYDVKAARFPSTLEMTFTHRQPVLSPQDDAWPYSLHVCKTERCGCTQVMLPPTGNVIDVLAADPNYGTLVKLLKLAGLADALQADGPFTIFAPTNRVSGLLSSSVSLVWLAKVLCSVSSASRRLHAASLS